MKKALTLLLALAMMFTLFACSSDSSSGTSTSSGSTAAAPADNSASAPSTSSGDSATPAKTYNWKMQTNVNANTLTYDSAAVAFADLVRERTNGAVDIEVYPAGAIVAAPEITASVGKGVIEMGLSGPPLDVGFLTEAQMAAGLPFGWEDGRQTYEYWHEYKDGEAYNILNSAYNEIGVQFLQLMPFEDGYGLMTKTAIDKVDDLKGMKIRATGNYGKIMANLGVSTVNLAIAEVYMGLSTGAVDGVVMGFSTLNDFQLKEVLTSVIKPPFSPGAGSAFYCNLDVWNSLSDELKEIVFQAACDTYLDVLEPTSIKVADNLFNKVIPEAGMTVVTLTEEESAKLIDASAPIWESVGSACERNTQMMDLLKEFLDSKDVSYPGE